MKSFRYLVEGIFVSFLIFIFKLMPVDMASAIGGFLGKHIGTRLAAGRKALRNLMLALPGKTDAEYKLIMDGMWENLGRTFAEYPHLETITTTRTVSIGDEYLEPVKKAGKPCILFTGHLANWEIPAAYAHKLGVDLDLIYRAPNNSRVDRILQECRSLGGKLVTYPKSSKGMRDVMMALKNGRRIGILIDQKYNQGLAMPFFRRTAMTSPAFVQLAQRFDCPLIPARVERLEGAHFRITIYPPLVTKDRSVEDVITESHALLEKWITEHPSQWLWVHRRWKDNKADGI